jgi:hypothetical protein
MATLTGRVAATSCPIWRDEKLWAGLALGYQGSGDDSQDGHSSVIGQTDVRASPIDSEAHTPGLFTHIRRDRTAQGQRE